RTDDEVFAGGVVVGVGEVRGHTRVSQNEAGVGVVFKGDAEGRFGAVQDLEAKGERRDDVGTVGGVTKCCHVTKICGGSALFAAGGGGAKIAVRNAQKGYRVGVVVDTKGGGGGEQP